MSLDEAIRYYSRLADECRRKANIERYDYMDLKDLAAEHGQLADWLNELKVLREKIQTLLKKQEADKWIPVTENPKKPNYQFDTYLVYTKYERFGVADYLACGSWIGYDIDGDQINGDEITAWRRLPETYQEDKA